MAKTEMRMQMGTTDLGLKYVCFSCGTRFYDLKRTEPLCPRCGANQREAPPPKAQKAQAAAVNDDEEFDEVDLEGVGNDDLDETDTVDDEPDDNMDDERFA